MIQGIYSSYDKVDKVYGVFVLDRSERSVIRGFITQFERDKKINPKEYDLMCFGTFDDQSGKFELYPTPVKVDLKKVYADVPADGDIHDE